MPGGDGTGPAGMGPMTGGGRGFCSPQRRFSGFGARQNFGKGGNGGRGWRNWFRATGLNRWQRFFGGGQSFGAKEEMLLLKDHAASLSEQLDEVQKRINELEQAKVK